MKKKKKTRWSMTLPSKVKSPHAINFRAVFGANLVTYPANFRGVDTLEVHRPAMCARGPSNLRRAQVISSPLWTPLVYLSTS